MSQLENQSNNQSNNRFNAIIMTVVGQVGCLTPMIILVALFTGLWLDGYFETKPLFTILFIVGSAPVSIFALYKIVKTATTKLKIDDESLKEDLNRE
ncbi:MAG: AtpZ/AtpI family protein [Anaerolineae bacterium]|jgi:F0F1-type ATP synthase assembly protein I|nr:AtpZ/AtpI family protein [Anaerolineae bacterium]MBT3711870.1 AtpZ/AtpI family protein [Anaerolineae bacterium]MBT4311122.1 AtpZ/AtpI family protein [Anaerolineae bacterium]MBT4459383.1 AtpZ/AtpI family protein [Anaerolineae bacterium]MBT4841285.1 AtpZ/AtpI family protein [Anaerolineae bacterium]